NPNFEGTLIRIHVGLEDVEDLIADLEAGFARYNALVLEKEVSLK
ncbi:TPA: PLP-dependent transferase, partial [Vibrio parahaemolyticus]|nr:PLP-dependent transferase [Vibrio parahaemolyticus]